MAETKLTNAVIPEIFTAYTAEESIYKSRLYRSGAVQLNPGMSALLAGGGEIFQTPEWGDVGGTSGDIPVEASDVTINNLAAHTMKFRRQLREKAWGTNDMVKVFAGNDPMTSLQNMVISYWAQAYEINAVRCLQGFFLDNIANDTHDLVNDISSLGSPNFSADGVIDTQALIGENGVVGSGDNNEGDFVAIAVHPLVYAWMRKQDLIDFIPVSGQIRPLQFFMGMEVIVYRNSPVSAGVYDTYLLKAGALQFGQSTAGYMPTETDRDPKSSFGIDQLFTRRAFAMTVYGTAWLEGSVAGAVPTDAELALAANWNRVKNQENMRVVMFRHKIG